MVGRFLLAAVALLAWLAPAWGSQEPFVDLFNGRDLSGWVPVNVAPSTFTVEDGLLVCSGEPYGVLRTERVYENFVLELEWRHMEEGGNSGLFVWSDALPARGVPFTRSVEVQILDGRNTENYTSHGDIFPIHGATFVPDRPHPNGWMRSLPSEWRCNPAGEWNHYRVTCLDGTIKLEVNGKEVSGGSETQPRKGYICLESEGGLIHFRNIRIRELESTGAGPEETADLRTGFRTLYTGVDLSGWHLPDASGWEPRDWVLRFTPGEDAAGLWTATKFADLTLIVDWRIPQGQEARPAELFPRGPEGPAVVLDIETEGARGPGHWNRTEASLRDGLLTVQLNGEAIAEVEVDAERSVEGPVGLVPAGRMDFANLFVKTAE